MGSAHTIDTNIATDTRTAAPPSFLEELQSPRRLLGWRTTFGWLITLIQVVADFTTAFSCFFTSYWFYTTTLERSSPQSLEGFLWFGVFASALYILLLDREGLYRREISLLNVKEIRGIVSTGIIGAALILSAMFYVRSVSFSRITLTLALVGTPLLIGLQRQIFYQIHLIFHQRGWSRQRVLIYGAGKIGVQLAKRMFESPALGLLPVGFLDDGPDKHGRLITWTGFHRKKGVRVLGGEEAFKNIEQLDVDMIVIALPSASFERNQALVRLCIEKSIPYAIVPNTYESFVQHVETFEIGGIPLIRRRQRQTNRYFNAAKRIFDFIVSLVLILALSPLYLFFAALIKLSSPGPVIFKQKRVGLNGREFSFYKFRTMYNEVDRYALTPTHPHDIRITGVGRWLRRTSIDELPQLFNVFRGDMSFVGPRPEMPFIVKQYDLVEQMRLFMKPGITGVWQISAARGEPIHANLEYDLFYLENQSLLLDFVIIMKTILSVVRGLGAH